MKLSIKQTKALDYLEDSVTNEVLFGGSAGGGKSFLGCYWMLKNRLRYPNTRGLIGRAKRKTLYETTLNSFWAVCSLQGVKPNVHYTFNSQTGLMKFFNGSEILWKDLYAYPSDPEFDELGSLEITDAFIDEANQITVKAKQIVRSRIRYNLNKYLPAQAGHDPEETANLVPSNFNEVGQPIEWISKLTNDSTPCLQPKILMTCNPAKNWTYSQFFKPNQAGTLQENRQFIQSLVTDNPYVDPSYIENLKQLDPASQERLLHGNWDYENDPSGLCSYDAICDTFTNDIPNGKKCISADLAMQGRDSFVAGLWDGFQCTIKIDMPKATGQSIELALKQLKLENGVMNSNIVADADGMGNYLESYIQNIYSFHGNQTAKDKQFANIKSECGFKLAELINKGEIRINCSQEQEELIKQELSVCLKRDNIDADNQKKRLMAKGRMKELLGRSPDYLDMLLMRMVLDVKQEYEVFL